jgi:glutamate N-acetyltransferase/amino-acid N-acetyltransferase
MQISFVDGGVCAPKGFVANGMRVGIKESRKINDTALVFSEVPCNAAGVFTQNRVQSESVKIAKKYLADGKAQAAIEISGNANTCTGAQGAENAFRMAKCAADALGIKTEDVIVYSTGVIGAQFDVTKVENNIQTLKTCW